MKYLILRTFLIALLWIPLAVSVFQYSEEELSGKRFEAMTLSNGRVSSIQREFVFRKTRGLQPGDQMLSVDGIPFEPKTIKTWLRSLDQEVPAEAEYLHKGERQWLTIYLRNYSRNDVLLYLIFPGILSLIFLAFSVITPFQRAPFTRAREATEVFSLLCLYVSVFFLSLFPAMTLEYRYPVSLGLPILGALLMHLFLVYPKKKGSVLSRTCILSTVYVLALAVIGLRIRFWFDPMPWWFHLLDIFCLALFSVMGLVNLANTLFTSKDFWARRRARLLSLVFLTGFVAIVGAFVAFLWQGPRLSLERILGISVLFPVAFAFIISKENVFDLERIFRRGVHQFLFIGIAVTLSVLVGLGWQQWAEGLKSDWLLWTTIAMTVALLARPAGSFFEEKISKLISARIPFPNLEEIFEESHSTEEFLLRFSGCCEKDLNMRNIRYRFFRDPTRSWSPENEQEWLCHEGRMLRVYERFRSPTFFSILKRGDIAIGEIAFSGGDALAFDPVTSKDWERICQSLSRNLEVLILREFLSAQQGLLAVGRMQALLAHEMKNPLAVIKVCAGLLQTHIDDSEEGEEILKTIQSEVKRVSEGVQNIFNHSGRAERREKVDVYQVVERVKESVRARFPSGKIGVRLRLDKEEVEWTENCLWMWTEPEGFRQSLLNLAVNSFEAGSSKVDFEILVRSGRYLRIFVTDNGPGIPKEVELFKPFVSTKPTGTGLGLSHVKAFVDRHFGRIQVQSRGKIGASVLMEFSPDAVFVEPEASIEMEARDGR